MTEYVIGKCVFSSSLLAYALQAKFSKEVHFLLRLPLLYFYIWNSNFRLDCDIWVTKLSVELSFDLNRFENHLKPKEYCGRAVLVNPNDGNFLTMYAELVWTIHKGVEVLMMTGNLSSYVHDLTCGLHISVHSFLCLVSRFIYIYDLSYHFCLVRWHECSCFNMFYVSNF